MDLDQKVKLELELEELNKTYNFSSKVKKNYEKILEYIKCCFVTVYIEEESNLCFNIGEQENIIIKLLPNGKINIMIKQQEKYCGDDGLGVALAINVCNLLF